MNIFFKSPLVLFFLLLLLPHGSPFAATSHMYPFCTTTVRAHNLNTKFQLMSLCAVSFHIYLSNKHTHTQCTSLFAFLFKQHRRERLLRQTGHNNTNQWPARTWGFKFLYIYLFEGGNSFTLHLQHVINVTLEIHHQMKWPTIVLFPFLVDFDRVCLKQFSFSSVRQRLVYFRPKLKTRRFRQSFATTEIY